MAIKEIYEQLVRDADYALNSKSRDLVYKTYGKVEMARTMCAITKEQFIELNTKLVKNGLNNPKADLHPEELVSAKVKRKLEEMYENLSNSRFEADHSPDSQRTQMYAYVAGAAPYASVRDVYSTITEIMSE